MFFVVLTAIIQIIAIFGVPIVILRYRNIKLTRTFGAVGMAYFCGIIASVVIWLLRLCNINVSLISDINEISSYLAIGIAIPLLLFSCSIGQLKRLTKTVLLSFCSLTLSVIISAILVYAIWAKDYDGGKNIAAMAMGMYTGGTPNFISIGLATETPFELIAIGNLCDMIIGGVFYIFLLLAAKPLLGKFLGTGKEASAFMRGKSEAENVDNFVYKPSKAIFRNVLIAMACAIVGAGVGLIIWIIKGSIEGTMTAFLVPGVMITVTILGIAFSFIGPIRSVKENSSAGQYLILVFSFALASCLDLTKISGPLIYVFLTLLLITIFSFVIHVILSKILGIGIDCTLVTLTAGIYGPAFIPALTKQLKNEDLTAPGLICGSIGYAIGTVLGLAVFYFILLF